MAVLQFRVGRLLAPLVIIWTGGAGRADSVVSAVVAHYRELFG